MKHFITLCALMAVSLAGETREKRGLLGLGGGYSSYNDLGYSGYSAPNVRYTTPIVRYSAPVVRYSAPIVRYSAPVVRYSAPIVRYSAPVAPPVVTVNRVVSVPQVVNVRKVVSVPEVVAPAYAAYSAGYSGYGNGWW